MRFKLVLAALLALACLTCKSREEAVAELESNVNGEIARLETALRTLDRSKLPPPVAELTAAYGESFERLKKTKSPLLRLYRLRDTFIGIETLVFVAENRNAANSVASLKALAGQRRAALEAKQEPLDAPLLYRALAEAAGHRAAVLSRASAPYGAISDEVWGGLYYLAEAEGNRKYREFVASLPAEVADDDERGGDRARLLAASNQLESEALAVFEQDPVSRGAIPASAKLKEARELLEANLLDGATLALVETKLALGRSKQALGDSKQALGNPKSALGKTKSGADPAESVPALLQAFVNEGTPPVNVVVDREVVPFYGSLLQPAPAAAVASRAIPNPVTVTLVRWPYT
jgi:hypothetical protein